MHEEYDAIVIGTGISGGWAAKELCENGLKTLVLERGRMVNHGEYPTAFKDPWDFEYRGEKIPDVKIFQKKQNRTDFITHPGHAHWFVNDLEHPYNETKKFSWIRGYQVGGRSITWGRHSYRLSDLDFEANINDGHGVDWPIRYKDLARWYDKVEKFIGVSGHTNGLEHLPDGIYLPPIALNCVEEHLAKDMMENFNRPLINGRVANLTDDVARDGRAPCQNRDRCMRGCPLGAYFSSLSSTLPAAKKTGNMVIRANSIVSEILYDDSLKRATGVKVIDSITKEVHYFNAKVIFCCASAFGSTSILLQSKSERFPNGLGNDSGELGHNIMDHHLAVGADGIALGYDDKIYNAPRPVGFYIPRFFNLRDPKTKNPSFLRGYGFQGSANRNDWRVAINEMTFGKAFKEQLLAPGQWAVGVIGFGEMLPHYDNKLTLNYKQLDQWGLPTLTFDVELKKNELAMRKSMKTEAIKMLKSAGFTQVKGWEEESSPGLGIHEMGTARMGRDPKTSVLNANNQLHAVPNVYVTDGACMTSSGCQNPSLTYMALTARAANHAAELMRKGEL